MTLTNVLENLITVRQEVGLHCI